MSNQPPYYDPQQGSNPGYGQQYPTNPNPNTPQYPQSPEYPPAPPAYPQQPGYGVQPGGYPQQASYPQQGFGFPVVQGGSGFGIAALILGILSILLFWTTLFDLVLIIPGVILGIVGRGRNRRGRGLALAGIITSVIGLLLVIGVFVAAALVLKNNPNLLNTPTPQ